MGSRQGDQRNGGIVQPQVDRNRVVIPRTAVKKIDVIAKILFKADAGVQVMKPGKPGFGRYVVPARHALLPDVGTRLPASERLVVIGRQAKVFAPRLCAQSGTLQVVFQQVVVKGVVAQQPVSGNPALPDPDVAHQPVCLLRQAKLAPAQIAGVVVPGDKPASAAAVKVTVVIHQYIDIGVTPGGKPGFDLLVDFPADGIPHLAKRELSRLLPGRQAVIDHTGFTEGLCHFSQVLFAFGSRLRHTEIRQTIAVVIKRILRLLHEGFRRTVNGSSRKKGE